LKIHFNVDLPSGPKPAKWSLFLLLPTKTLYAPHLSAIHATCPIHLILVDLITQIAFGEEIIKLLFM